MPRELSDAEVEELLGAYALDALDPDEIVAIEAVLARRPDLALEADRLSSVAAWLGATEATEPPGAMREGVLDAALARRRGPADPVIDVYLSLSDRLERAIVDLPDDALDVVTPNGLTAAELVVHMAAQESLLAQNLGTPTIDDLVDEDIVPRTHALLPRFAGRELDRAVVLWRDSVEANRAWAVANPERTAIWRGLGLTRDDTLLVRAFEAWVHTDDLRRAAGVARHAARRPSPHAHVRPGAADPPARAGGVTARARRQDRAPGAHGPWWWRLAGADGRARPRLNPT